MVESWSAINCTTKRAKGIKLKFHRIPKDPRLRQAWLIAIRRKNFHPSYSAVICEKHFTEESYEINVHGNKVLKKGAVPSIFDFPSHLKKPVKKRRPLNRIIENEEPEYPLENVMSQCSNVPVPMEVDEQQLNITLRTENINLEVTTSKEIKIKRKPGRNRRDPIYFGDFKESDLSNGSIRKRFWKVAQGTVSKYKKLVKYYQCRTRRQQFKIKSLNALLNELKRQQKISSEQACVLKVD